MRRKILGFYFFLLLFLFFQGFIFQSYAREDNAVTTEKIDAVERDAAPRKVTYNVLYFIGHGDGTITDTKTGLMWTETDSLFDLGKCLSWNDSKSYVNRLTTGGYGDWRLPTIEELIKITPLLEINNKSSKPTYWLWSSEPLGPCCAQTVYFDGKRIAMERRNNCVYEGVRAVRNP